MPVVMEYNRDGIQFVLRCLAQLERRNELKTTATTVAEHTWLETCEVSVGIHTTFHIIDEGVDRSGSGL
jgi:hypothetical protein